MDPRTLAVWNMRARVFFGAHDVLMRMAFCMASFSSTVRLSVSARMKIMRYAARIVAVVWLLRRPSVRQGRPRLMRVAKDCHVTKICHPP